MFTLLTVVLLRPTVRGESTDSGDRRQSETEEDTPTIYGDCTSEKFNAKIVGYTKEGDVILRLSPEFSREFTRKVTTQPSIAWDERPRTSPPPTRDDKEPSRHRSTSSVTFKGKEREEIMDGIKYLPDGKDERTSEKNSLNVDLGPEFRSSVEKDVTLEETDLGVRRNRSS